MHHRKTVLRGALALVGAGWLAGCASLPSQPGSNEILDPEFVRVDAAAAGVFGSKGSGGSGSSTSASQTQKIDGAKGGTVGCGRFKLLIPPGAFKGSATIKMVIPDLSVLVCDLAISPASANNFLVPVTLAADCSNTSVTDPSTLVQAWFDEAAGVWREVPGSTVDTTTLIVSAPLNHFSTYGVVTETKAGW